MAYNDETNSQLGGNWPQVRSGPLVVGGILILAGALGLLLPRLARSRRDGDWLRRWVRPGQRENLGVPTIAPDQGSGLPAQVADTGSPTLADELLSYEAHR